MIRNVVLALILSISLALPVEAKDVWYTVVDQNGNKTWKCMKKRFSIKRLVRNTITAPLWIAEETIRHACVAYCYSHIKGPHSPWTGIAAESHREKILLEKKD